MRTLAAGIVHLSHDYTVAQLPNPRQRGERTDQMSERTYRVTEIVGTSPEGIEPAIRGALHRAAQTLRHLDWFEVTQIRGQIVDGDVAHFQVDLKVGFRLEDA
jgi:flavin-binding protein dodecin